MNSKNCFIISVGTSIIDNIFKKSQTDICFLRNQIDDIEINEDLNHNFNNLPDSLNCKFEKLKKFVQKEINDNCNFIKDVSAELKSLLLYYYKQNSNGTEAVNSNKSDDKNKICLFPTYTSAGLISCCLINYILSDKLYFKNIEIVLTKKLRKPNDEKFENEGLPEFISNLSGKIEENRDSHNIIIIPTGGYKSLIPYMVIMGILYNTEDKPIKLIYNYEESNTLISLPILPIGININEIKANIIKIKSLINTNYDLSAYGLPKSLEGFFSNEKPLELTAFGQLIMKRYNELENKNIVDIQAAGSSILKYLKRNNEKPDLNAHFIKLNKIGSKFWIGDKLPEIVDHALYHHNNLFEITDIILTLIFKKQKFLKPEELFILLCTIYFHDWGHTLSYYEEKGKEPISLLPTEIRDFHHILSYQRIINEKENLYNLLEWDNCDGSEELFNKYLNTIGHVCLYHRNIMPLNNNNNTFHCYINDKTYEPLEKIIKNNELCFENISLKNKETDLLFLTSLFRVIDSLDTQSIRAGTEEEFYFKIITFLNDLIIENKKLQELDKIFDNNKKKELINIYNNITNKREEYNYRKDLKSFEEKETPLVNIYLETKLKIYLKTVQLKHFFKHLFFDKPCFSIDNNENNIKIIVEYTKYDKYEKIIKKFKEIIKNYRDYNSLENIIWTEEYENPCINNLLNEIKKDYENTEVKKIINDKCLEFEFEFKK